MTISYDTKHPFRVKRCRHGMFVYSLNDIFIGRSMDQYGEWCEFELGVMSQFIKPGDLVIDVGANIGTHTLAFSGMVGNRGRVYAFEPQPRLYRTLLANLNLNEIKNVTPRCQVVGHTTTDMEIADLPPDEMIFNFGALPLNADTPIMLRSKMIDIDALGVAPTLIKIDVEGMETMVLEGARMTISRYHPTLYIEANEDNCTPIAEALAKIHYRAYWSMGNYYQPDNFFGSTNELWDNVMPSVNLLAVHRDIEIDSVMVEFQGAGDNWKAAVGRMV